MATNGPENGEQPQQTQDAPQEEAPEALPPAAGDIKLPTRKDMSLKEFLNKMDDYAPIVRISTPSF